MGEKTALGRDEEYRLRILIELMQQQGKTEREITEAVREATAER